MFIQTPAEAAEAPYSFLAGGGDLARLIAAFDWTSTSLGPLARWPAHVKTATGLMLRSRVPMAMLWGDEGVLVYNDGYAVLGAERHPQLLGAPVRDAWAEAADFNDHVMRTGLAGDTLQFRDQELTLHRHGRDEQVWFDLDYSPILDDAGRPCGVMAVVHETTTRVQVERFKETERERLAQLFEQAPSFMAMLQGPTHRFELVNPKYLEVVQREVLGLTVAEALPDAAQQGYLALLDQVYATGEAFRAHSLRFDRQVHPGAPPEERYVDFVYQPIRDAAGRVSGIFVEGIDATERVVAEHRRTAVADLTDRFREMERAEDVEFAAAETLGRTLGVSRVGYGTIATETDTLHVVRDWTAPGVDTLAGVTHLRDYGSFIDSLKANEFISIADVRLDPRTAPAHQALEGRHARSFVNVPVVERGQLVAVMYVNHADVRQWTAEDHAFIRDVSERTRIAAERVRSVADLLTSQARLREANETLEQKVEARTRELMAAEAALRQSQKMEAIGQLTGGIAHDFNNLLAAMSGSLQVVQRRLDKGLSDNKRYLDMALNSVQRAAALTQRLLAFSRRQTLDPKPLDPNQLVRGLEDLLRRTVGPSVELQVEETPGLWTVRADVSQLENALLNLCINGRDAMAPHGGRLTVATENSALDGAAAAGLDLPAGDYVHICVTDTGAGMSPEVAARAFDPFFTTKPIGQGTGLGLSMIYGFARQSGGQVRIESATGQGTTMHLYLPRHRGAAEFPAPARSPAEIDAQAAGEVILLIEDEPTIRTLVTEELENAGYRVLSVSDGQAGLRWLQSDTRIDLLLTDVGLPGGLNGRQVADAGRVSRPLLKVLFITGYAEGSTVGDGLLEPGMEVVTKPFAITNLVAKVQALVEKH
jgi:signal transduction histidine kinase/PAS domain-containing protein/ActR/RegA family two-component response regulator